MFFKTLNIKDIYDLNAMIRQPRSVPYEEVAKDYNLSVSTYVQAKDTREVIDITELNAELKVTVTKIDQLRKDIDGIVAEIER